MQLEGPATSRPSRRQVLAALLIGGASPWSARAALRRSPVVRYRWDSENNVLAPLGYQHGQLLFAGDRSVGRIDSSSHAMVWNVAHTLTQPAVFRPRSTGSLVLCGSLNRIGAWTVEEGRAAWHYTASVQLGTPWVTARHTFMGDGHQLLAIENSSGKVIWRFAGTPDTLTSYSPTVTGNTVLFGPGNGLLYGLSTDDGAVLWTLDRSKEWQYLRQLYVSGDILIAGSYKELLYGISVSTGAVLWTFNAGNFINSHHVAGDTAYLWSPTGWIFALDVLSGKLRWRHQTTNYRQSDANWGPLMAELATHGDYLHALDMRHILHVLHARTGEEAMQIPFGYPLRPSFVPISGESVIVATERGEIQEVQW